MKHTALHLAVFGVLAGAALAAQAADVQPKLPGTSS